jgi:hypothetical protein
MKTNTNLFLDNRDISSRISHMERFSGAASPFLYKTSTPTGFTRNPRVKKTKTTTIMRSNSKDVLRSTSDVLKVSKQFHYKVPYKVEEVSISCSPRPNTAPFRARTILSAARKLEVASPKDPPFKKILQEESSTRLYKGTGFISPSADVPRNPIFRFESLMQTDKDESEEYEYMHKENQEFQDYMQSLYCLKDLNFDLELNYKLARNNEVNIAPRNMNIGSLYTVQEELKSLFTENLETLLGLSRSEYSIKLDTYTKILREILRNLKGKGLNDEAVVLELLWRVIIKFFDSSIRLHDSTINKAVETNRHRIKSEADTKKMESDKIEQEYQNKLKLLADEIDFLKKSLERSKKDRESMRERMNEKEMQISQLTRIDDRNETMQNMKNLLISLNNVISETEDEQHKQIRTLRGMTTLINLATHTEKKPKVSENGAQTDWSMLPIQYPIPEVRRITMSDHPFYEIIKSANKEVEFNAAEVREVLHASLREHRDDASFIDAFLFKLAEKYEDTSEFKSIVKSTYLWLTSSSRTDIWSKIYYKFLGLSYPTPQELYLFSSKLLLKLEEISSQETTTGRISLPETINLISRLFKTERDAALNILSSLSYKPADFSTKYAKMEYSATDQFLDKLSSILCRISLRMEKIKNHRIALEKADSSKSGNCNI